MPRKKEAIPPCPEPGMIFEDGIWVWVSAYNRDRRGKITRRRHFPSGVDVNDTESPRRRLYPVHSTEAFIP